MKKPELCASITEYRPEEIEAVAGLVDYYELRIDLLGDDWRILAASLKKPWIACNRIRAEGGRWSGSEKTRLDLLLEAADAGAAFVDIELQSILNREFITAIKEKSRCLVSAHNLTGTPSLAELRDLANRQLEAGADLCKVVTTARTFQDNRTVLELVKEFRERGIVAFAMGEKGRASRILCPLAGGAFTYGAVAPGRESASGQLTVSDLADYYQALL